jgi:hypothetical protein
MLMSAPVPFFTARDGGFSESACPHCVLRIQLGSSELALAVYHTLEKTVPVVEKYSLLQGAGGAGALEWAQRILRYNILFRQRFSSIEWIWTDVPYTLVPETYFVVGEENAYLSYTSARSDLICFNYSISSAAIRLVYGIPSAWYALRNELKEFTHTHLHIAAILLQLNPAQTEGAQRMVLHFSERHFDLLTYVSDKLILSNTYTYHTPDECVYFLVAVAEQFSLDREHCVLWVCGDIEFQSALLSAIKLYFRKVKFMDRPIEPNLTAHSDEGSKINTHALPALLHPQL